MTHNFIMSNKCPNTTTTSTTTNLIETMIVEDYNIIETIIQPDLSVTYKSTTEPQLKFIYTNFLQIKCPICLGFKMNCVIQKCGHCLCRDCINTFMVMNDYKCWICRNDSQDSIILSM